MRISVKAVGDNVRHEAQNLVPEIPYSEEEVQSVVYEPPSPSRDLSFSQFESIRENTSPEAKKKLYEKYYANKPHEKARSTTPKNLSTRIERIEPRTFDVGSDRRPKHQEPATVHPSRYNVALHNIGNIQSLEY